MEHKQTAPYYLRKAISKIEEQREYGANTLTCIHNESEETLTLNTQICKCSVIRSTAFSNQLYYSSHSKHLLHSFNAAEKTLIS